MFMRLVASEIALLIVTIVNDIVCQKQTISFKKYVVKKVKYATVK